MIISASRRTDIPAFFSEWIINRFTERCVYVRNPLDIHHVSKIDLSPDVVDCIVFWSKNPQPIINKLNALKEYMYYFQFTLNAYDADVEKNLPALDARIDTFQTLSNRLGKERVLWRYDPIVNNEKYTVDWHIEKFKCLAERLHHYTEKVTISFIDLYAKISRNIQRENMYELSYEQKNILARHCAEIAHSYNIEIEICAENIDLSSCGIAHARCIDDRLISKLLHCSMDVKKDKNQRLECGCVASIDVGLYNTCQNGCIYCYANHNPVIRAHNFEAYDPLSPLLCSRITESDKITERNVKTRKTMQPPLLP